MARAPDPRIEQAKAMYLEGEKLVEIASQLNLPEGTVRRWKCTHKWDNERSDKKNERSRKRKRGAQPKNQNAVGNNGGAPEQNKNAEKFGFFSKYLPEETVSIYPGDADGSAGCPLGSDPDCLCCHYPGTADHVCT